MEQRNNDILVTIQCITYNHQDYIGKCIDSLLMQSTDFRYEIIVHDDASNDETANIIKDYALKYPDLIIPIFEKENLYSKQPWAISEIINKRSRGKYIAMCEGDDYWIDPKKLQKQVDFMERNQDYSLCGTNGMMLWDGFVNQPSYFNNILESKELFPQDIIGNWCFPTASLLYKAEILDLFPDWKTQIISGDLLLILVCMAHGKIYALNDITCVYRRILGGSILSRKVHSNRKRLTQNIRLLYDNYSEYSNHQFDEYIESYIKQLNYKLSIIGRITEMCRYGYMKIIQQLFKSIFERKRFHCVIN